jgi:integral membrane sensor domain MASE1
VNYLRHAQEPTYSFVILTFVLILVNTALAWISVKFIPAGIGGIALVYIAVAFMILFTLWFGAYGAIAAYVGTLLAGVLTTESLLKHPEIAIIWAVAGLLQVLIPLVAVRKFGVDLTLQNRRDWTIILLFAVLINNVVGAAWGAFTLSLLPGSTLTIVSIFSTWLIGNIIITILIVPLALRFLTEKVNKSKLFVKQYWD